MAEGHLVFLNSPIEFCRYLSMKSYFEKFILERQEQLVKRIFETMLTRQTRERHTFWAEGLESTTLNSTLGVEVAQRSDLSTSGRSSSSDINTQSIDERAWVLSQTVIRPSLVSTLEWNVNDSPGTILASYVLPKDLIVNSLNSAPFNAFKYWRGNITLQLQVNGSPMHQGILKVVFIPLTYADGALARLNPVDISINEHVTLFANSSSSATLNIPYVSPVNYLDVKIPADELRSALGTLYILVWNKLAAATNSVTTVSVSMFASLPDSEFKVPRLQTFVAQGLLTPFDSVLKPLSNMAASGLSSLTGGLIPKNFISDGIDILRGVTGLDKPSNYMNAAPAVFSSVGPMNDAVGEVYLEKLTPFPGNVATMNTKDISYNKDEMTFEYLTSRMSYLGSFDITTQAAAGNVLAYFPVNPICTDIGKLSYQPTLLGYVSMPFQFWQGSLRFHFEIASTSMQTCKLFVAYNPGLYVPSNFSLQEITAQYGMTIDIAQGGNTFEYEVPFIAPTPFLEVPHSNDTTLGTHSLNTTGMIHVILLNRLISPNALPTTINCNVYISAGSNFRLMNISAANVWTPVEPAILPIAFKAEGIEAVEPLNEVPVSEHIIDSPTGIAKDQIKPFKEGTINPGISTSVRDYCKKYQMISFGVASSNPYTKIDLRDVLRLKPNTRSNGLLTWFTSMYRNIHGGLRFKISIRDNSPNVINYFNQYRVYYLPPLAYTGAYNAITSDFNGQFENNPNVPFTRLNVTMINSIDRTLHFEVPYSVLFNFNLTMDDIDGLYATSIFTDLGSIYIVNDAVAGLVETQQFTIHVSYADETRCFMLYKVPVLSRDNIYYPDTWEGVTFNNLINLF